MKKAAIYCRVSTADQHVESQLYDLRELAAQRGMEIVNSLRLDELAAPGFAEVTVVSQQQHSDHIVLHWPDIEYSLLNIGGWLISFQERMPLQGVELLLLDIPAGHEIAKSTTDVDGHYALALPKDGVYVLRFRPSATSDRHQDFAIEVNSVSGKGEMPVMVVDDDKNCGLNIAEAD